MDVGLNNRNTLGQFDKEFEDVVFLVEATSAEYSAIWSNYAPQSMTNIQPISRAVIDTFPPHIKSIVEPMNRKVEQFTRKRVSWKEIGMGISLPIGKVCKTAVYLTFRFAIINEKKVCFYDCTSRYVDHTMIENFLIKHFQRTNDNYTRWNHTDATNFHNCINSLDNIDEKPRNTIYKHKK